MRLPARGLLINGPRVQRFYPHMGFIALNWPLSCSPPMSVGIVVNQSQVAIRTTVSPAPRFVSILKFYTSNVSKRRGCFCPSKRQL